MRKQMWNAHKEALRELRLRHEDEYHQILEKKIRWLAAQEAKSDQVAGSPTPEGSDV